MRGILYVIHTTVLFIIFVVVVISTFPLWIIVQLIRTCRKRKLRTHSYGEGGVGSCCN